MKRIAISAFLAISLLIPSVLSQESQHLTATLVRQAATPSNKVSRCTRVLDQKEMESELGRVGWSLKEFNPSINWRDDCVIIIAPGKSYPLFRLVFIDLKWNGHEFRIRWGYWSDLLKFYRGSSTFTQGYQMPPPGLPQILIVVVKLYVYTANKLICEEYDSG